MDPKVQACIEWFSTNGTFAEAVAFSQLVAAQAWGEVSKLYHVIQGAV